MWVLFIASVLVAGSTSFAVEEDVFVCTSDCGDTPFPQCLQVEGSNALSITEVGYAHTEEYSMNKSYSAQSTPPVVTPITDLKMLVYDKTNPKMLANYLDYQTGACDNVKIRTEPNALSGDSDELLSKTGYYDAVNKKWKGEVWRMAFVKYVYTSQGELFGKNVVGYANNDNRNSNLYTTMYPGYGFESWFSGYYYNGVGVNEVPDEVMLIHDLNGDGVGNHYFYPDSGIGQWVLGDDDTPYWHADIRFGDKELPGDLDELPLHTKSGIAYLPSTIIVDKRTSGRPVFRGGINISPQGITELNGLSEGWIGEAGVHNNWGNWADMNTDGKVDFSDFGITAKSWLHAD